MMPDMTKEQMEQMMEEAEKQRLADYSLCIAAALIQRDTVIGPETCAKKAIVFSKELIKQLGELESE